MFCFQFLFSFLLLLLFVSCICRYHLIVDNKSFLCHKMAVKCTHIHAHINTHTHTNTHSRHQCMCLQHFRWLFVTLCCIYSVFCALCSLFDYRSISLIAALYSSQFSFCLSSTLCQKKTSIKTIDCNRIISANFHLSKLSAVIG